MRANLLSLLGLCKKAGMLAVGEEPADTACRAKDARMLLVAADAAENTQRRVRHFAESGNCPWLQLPFTKGELGQGLGRTSCAILAVTDIGFASAIAHRLAEEDGRYQPTADTLALKAQRAAKRRAEQRLHEKNLRQGKGRKRPGPAAPSQNINAPPSKRSRERPPSKAAGPGSLRISRPHRRGGSPSGWTHQSGGPAPDGGRAGNRRGGATSPSRPGARTAKGPATPSDKTFRPDRRLRQANVFSHSRPVKKGKGSGRKPDGK